MFSSQTDVVNYISPFRLIIFKLTLFHLLKSLKSLQYVIIVIIITIIVVIVITIIIRLDIMKF